MLHLEGLSAEWAFFFVADDCSFVQTVVTKEVIASQESNWFVVDVQANSASMVL